MCHTWPKRKKGMKQHLRFPLKLIQPPMTWMPCLKEKGKGKGKKMSAYDVVGRANTRTIVPRPKTQQIKQSVKDVAVEDIG